MFNYFYILFFLASFLTSSGLTAQTDLGLVFDPVKKGEKRWSLGAKDFELMLENSTDYNFKMRLVEDSLEWVRGKESSLLLPRMALEIFFDGKSASDFSVSYLGRNLSVQQVKEKTYLKLFVSLFESDPIVIYEKGEMIATLNILPHENSKGPFIDYSCAPYDLEIEGGEEHLISVGCRLKTAGSIGHEKSYLEVNWVAPQLRIPGQKKTEDGVFTTHLSLSYPSSLRLESLRDNSELEINVKAKAPFRNYRLKTSMGFGPHSMTTREGEKSSSNELMSPVLIYGRFDLNQTSSFRFFNAFFYRESIFNKFGFYFAYDVGKAFDGRLQVTPLLGLQMVSFKSEFSDKSYSEGVYPQGFELVYHHPFGLKNYKLVYGLFLSPVSNENYRNTWIRFGKKIFWEVNYLSWKKERYYSKTWGLSVGIPFMNFF